MGWGAYYAGTNKNKKIVENSIVENQNTNQVNDKQNNQTKNFSTDNWKTYKNTEYGIEFKYPFSSIIKENELPNGIYPKGGHYINLSVPFIDKYDSWVSKSIDIIITKSSCSDYLPNTTLEKRVINGISYLLQDPDWTATSGMSSISKWRKYFYESVDKCYMIDERLRGLGNNERPSTYTFPLDVNKFLDSELSDLDKIIETIKL